MDNCVCGNKIENWEAVCKECWRSLKRHDMKFSTNFRESVVTRFKNSRRRDVLNIDMISVIRARVVHRKTYRMLSLKAKMKSHCMKCEENTGQKSIDDCFHCAFHLLINRIYKEILNNGH